MGKRDTITGLDPVLLNRIRMEYVEMPGLALTKAQATRLWHLDEWICERLLRHLVRENFLAEFSGGRFIRLDSALAAR
jgi:hypothetical protein